MVVLWILLLFSLSSCSVDIFGFFASSDQDVRLKDKNTFHMVTDRNISNLGDSYEFLVTTDTHIDKGDAHGLERLTQVIGNAKFVVVLGDVTQNGSEEDVRTFKRIAENFGVPCYPVIGNHDVYFNNWHNWRDIIGSTSYRIDGFSGNVSAGNAHTTLFILDTANASVGNDQLDWLGNELRSAGNHVFIFTHTNLFVEGITEIQQLTDIRERARIMSLLDGRCDALFTGHLHRRIIKTIGSVHYITIEDFKSHKTYCRVRVSQTGITYTFETL
ncbi:MAG: metallophosphoesterase [Spirochaetaceae bacterium]|jgi:3',5'-cyclic AMP phosphodiesterase CpdA|nr:metallophosphoesterase [Spirochaetaceae bacterium]